MIPRMVKGRSVLRVAHRVLSTPPARHALPHTRDPRLPLVKSDLSYNKIHNLITAVGDNGTRLPPSAVRLIPFVAPPEES